MKDAWLAQAADTWKGRFEDFQLIFTFTRIEIKRRVVVDRLWTRGKVMSTTPTRICSLRFRCSPGCSWARRHPCRWTEVQHKPRRWGRTGRLPARRPYQQNCTHGTEIHRAKTFTNRFHFRNWFLCQVFHELTAWTTEGHIYSDQFRPKKRRRRDRVPSPSTLILFCSSQTCLKIPLFGRYVPLTLLNLEYIKQWILAVIYFAICEKSIILVANLCPRMYVLTFCGDGSRWILISCVKVDG